MITTAPLSDLAVLASAAMFFAAALVLATARALRPATSRVPTTRVSAGVRAEKRDPDLPQPMKAPMRRVTLAGWALYYAAVVAVVLGIVLRGLAADRAPWGNMYEFALVAVAVMATLCVAWPGQRSERLATAVAISASGMLMLSALLLWVPAGPLVPALQSYWLVIHVFAALVATGAFLLAGLCAVGHLWSSRRSQSESNTPSRSAGRLDELSRRLNAFGFPIWTFAALIAGPIWAKYAWGRYWAWDPKEVWAFITWVVYAGYLHARATAGVNSRKAAYISLLGVATLLFSFIGINVWGSGLHSYGGL